MFKIKTPFIILSLAVLISCKHHPIDPITPPNDYQSSNCSPDTAYFVNDILPIIASNCAQSGCHDAITHKKELFLYNYTGIMKIVKPGNPGGSDLYDVITTLDYDDVMPPPPLSQLSSAQIALILKWIQQGAKNNECISCDTTAVSFAADILPVMQQSCQACHKGASPSGGILLTNYAEVFAQVTNFKLLPAVKRTGPKPMPPSASLQQCTINKIQAWINAGAPNN
jgi:mono/diheme cytochrome c family protein